MKLYLTDLEYAKQNAQLLHKERLKGNMVCLFDACNRRRMVREFRTLANYYIADSGEFVFSGCFTLRCVRSVYLNDLLEVLDTHHVRYAFRTEVPNACGGLVDMAVSDNTLSNEHYTYVVAFDDEDTKNTVIEQTKDFCDFHFTEDGYAYVTFHDISLKEAVKDLLENQKIPEEDLICVCKDL